MRVPVSFIVVPQWQGSSSSRAMRLVDGALAIHGDLPTSSTTLIEVPLEAGDELATGIARFSSLRMVSERVQSAAAEATASGASWSLTVGATAALNSVRSLTCSSYASEWRSCGSTLTLT